MSDGFAAFDREWRYTHVNIAAAKEFQMSPEQLLGKTIWELWPPANDLPLGINFRRSVEENIPLQFETYYPAPLDQWFECRCHPTSDGLATFFTNITERKQAEEALRESEERFRVAQELSPDGFTILRPMWDVEGRVVDFTWVYQNAAVARMNGTDPKAVVGRRLLELFPSHGETDIFGAFQHVAESGETRVLETSYLGESIVTEIWLRLVVVPMGGQIAILAQDITERKRAEEELRRSEERLRLVLEASAIGTFEVDLMTGEGQWNAMEFELLGLKPGDVPSNPEVFFRYVHSDDIGMVTSKWEEAVRLGKLDVEFRIVRADGEMRWVAGRGRFVFQDKAADSAPGMPVRAIKFLGVNFDITERKRAEEEEQRALALFNTLVRTAPIGICFFDLDLRFVVVNDRLAEINGIPADEHIGRHVSEIVPSLAEVARNVTRRILETGEAVKDHEFYGETPASPHVVHYWNESWYPVKSTTGATTGFGVMVEDITERKRAENELRQSEQRLALAASGTRIGMFDCNMATGEVLSTEQHVKHLGLPTTTTTTTTTTTLTQSYHYSQWARQVHPEDRVQLKVMADQAA